MTTNSKDQKSWDKDVAGVIKNNEGRGYLEIPDYHLILDIDYKKIVRIIKQFAENLQPFEIKDQAQLVKSSFYKSINVVRNFLEQIYSDHQRLVDILSDTINHEISTDDTEELSEYIFERLTSVFMEFRKHYEWCKRSFLDSKRGELEEGSDFEVNYFEVILKEFEIIIDPFLLDLFESIKVLKDVVSQVVTIMRRYEVTENSLKDIYDHYADILSLIDSSNTISRGITTLLTRDMQLARVDHSVTCLKLTQLPVNLVHREVAMLQGKLFVRQMKMSRDIDMCRQIIANVLDAIRSKPMATGEYRPDANVNTVRGEEYSIPEDYGDVPELDIEYQSDADRVFDARPIDHPGNPMWTTIMRRIRSLDDYFAEVGAYLESESSQVSIKERVSSVVSVN